MFPNIFRACKNYVMQAEITLRVNFCARHWRPIIYKMIIRSQAPESIKNYVRNLKCNKLKLWYKNTPEATVMKSTPRSALNILIKRSKNLVIIVFILRPASILMNFNFVNKSRSRPLPTLDTKFCIIVKTERRRCKCKTMADHFVYCFFFFFRHNLLAKKYNNYFIV